MQSPNIDILISNEQMDITTPQNEPSKNIEHLNNIINQNKIQFDTNEDEDETKLASLEELTKQLLIELQIKRNDATAEDIKKNVISGWIHREKIAILRAEAAENRAQCAMAAAYRLAEERERLNRVVTEAKANCDALTNENEELRAKVRQMSADMLAHERREKETTAEKALYEASRKMFYGKIDAARHLIDKMNGWTATTKETMERLQEEVDNVKTFNSMMMEQLEMKEAKVEDLRGRLKDATALVANLTAKIGLQSAQNDINNK